MKLISTLCNILNTGAGHVKDRHEKLLIKKVNGVACSLIILSLTFGLLFYILSGNLTILMATTVESGLFVCILILNHYRKHTLAALLLQVVLNAAILYFGLLLGKAIDGLWLALFLIVTSFLFLKTTFARRISLSGGMLSLVLIELNKYYPVVTPFPFTPVVQLVVHYSAIGVILFITVLTLMHYLQYNKMLVTAMKRQTRELEKANRSLKVFMRELTHEIRTPLNAIYSIAQLKLMDAPDSAANEHLHYACHNVLSIINNVQDRSKMEAGRPDEVVRELFDVRSWIQEVCSIYQYLASTRHVQVKVDIAPQLPELLYEDKISLTKIANNIIGNAIKFSPRSSVVTVSIQLAAGQWQIGVKDQGAGISREKLATLFDEFTRERINFAEGTGLGLNIAQKLAGLLQGNIQVFSEPGKGSLFIICLPLHTSGDVTATAPPMHTDEHIFHGRRLLLVEDDLMSQQYLQRYLQSKGFEVVLAEDGLEGLYRANCDPFDIIVSDIGLPKMGGRELLAHLKTNRYLAHIPVVITSADTAIREEVLQAGAAGCLIKPVDFKLLHKVLKDTILQAALAPGTRA